MKSDRPKRNGHAQHPAPSMWDPDREPFEEIAEEFAQRHRRGERVSIEEYVRRYPEFAAEIRELFPSVVALERLGHAKRIQHVLAATPAPVQLGDFRILGEIARGGMGVVYEAEQVTLGRHVAVKVLPKQALRSERDVQRFEREAQTAARLHHTNIVPVFGVGEQDGLHYIVMQLIHGVGLDEILVQLKQILDRRDGEGGGPPTTSRMSNVKRSALTLLHQPLQRDASTASQTGTKTLLGTGDHDLFPTDANLSHAAPADHKSRLESRGSSVSSATRIRSLVPADYYQNVAKIGLQVANALGYAHQHGTLHRDVKPGNLLLDGDGVVWVADFGLAKAVEHDSVTWSGDIIGTLAYMAPERFQGEATALSDIYSLGLTLYELLTFQRAYDGKDRVTVMHRVANEDLPAPSKRNPHVPRDLGTIVLKATARNPADRYHSAEEMAEDLECFLADRPIQARRVHYAERVVRWCRRNRAVASIAGAAVVLLVTVATGGYLRETTQRHRAEATSALAVKALDEIYGQFAPLQLIAPDTDPKDLHEDDLLVSRELPLSKDVALLLENLLHFYDELSKQSDDSEQLAMKSISANRRVADIRRRLGQVDEARDTYEQTIHRVQQLGEAFQQSRAVRLELARALNGLGMVLREQRRRDDVVEAHQQALDLLDVSSPTADESFELARTLYLLYLAQDDDRRWQYFSLAKARTDIDRRNEHHSHRDRGRPHPAPQHSHDDQNPSLVEQVNSDRSNSIQGAIDILHDLIATHPAVPDYQFLLARCFLAFDRGNCSEGDISKYQTQAISMLEDLVQSYPEVAEYRYELGDTYRAIAWREHRHNHGSKRTPEALASTATQLRRAVALTTDLQTQHPNIPRYSLLKKRIHHILAMVLTDSHLLEEADIEYNEAIRVQQHIVQQSLEPDSHEMWLLILQLNHAQLLRDRAMYVPAQAKLEAVIEGLEALSKRPEIDDNRFYRNAARQNLSRAYTSLASVLGQLGKETEAEAMLRKAEQ